MPAKGVKIRQQGIPRTKEKVIEKLGEILKLGYSVNKACKLIGIPQSTVQTWIQNDEELRLKVNVWMAEPDLQASKNIINRLHGRDVQGDVELSKWWKERREAEDFSPKTRTEHSGGIDMNQPNQEKIDELTKKQGITEEDMIGSMIEDNAKQED